MSAPAPAPVRDRVWGVLVGVGGLVAISGALSWTMQVPSTQAVYRRVVGVVLGWPG